MVPRMDSSTFSWFRENATSVPGFCGTLCFEERLSSHTYYQIGGPASVVATPRSLGDLDWLAQGIRATGVPFFILGKGSNVLASDSGFHGVVVKTARMNLDIVQVSSDPLIVKTGASVPVSLLLRRAIQEGWGGFDFLTGIPGTIGGAVFMNAGTHLGETKDHLRRVEVFQMKGSSGLRDFKDGDLRFQYRKNLFLPEGAAIWSAEWELTPEEPAKVKTRIDELLSRRKATQPIDQPSCGSVFKNPGSDLRAWQVIDRLGLRGHRIGEAEFSRKHGNFILNLGKATAADVYGLIMHAKSRAAKELGIELEEEVKYLGEQAPL